MNDGRLQVLTAEDTYMKGGRFGAHRMYEMLQGALAEAQRNGQRVRTSGVMDWALHGAAGTEELMEYESRVNFLVPTYECTLLCVYDINEISGRMMMEILTTHPYIMHGKRYARTRTMSLRWSASAKCCFPTPPRCCPRTPSWPDRPRGRHRSVVTRTGTLKGL